MPIITEALSPFQLMPCLCFNESLQQNGFEWKVDRSLECRDQCGSYKHVKYQNADKCLGGGGASVQSNSPQMKTRVTFTASQVGFSGSPDVTQARVL